LVFRQQLRYLDFTGFCLGPEGASIISGVLRGHSLVSLKLGQTSLGDTGAAVLAKALTSHQTLTNFDLHSNDVSNSGAKALASLVSAPGAWAAGCLQTLSLRDNNIGTEVRIGLA
jgi:Ran GTPase-activating protein (RanGAP) involved in mRNA processing and transport